jgi:hypothetical protein
MQSIQGFQEVDTRPARNALVAVLVAAALVLGAAVGFVGRGLTLAPVTHATLTSGAVASATTRYADGDRWFAESPSSARLNLAGDHWYQDSAATGGLGAVGDRWYQDSAATSPAPVKSRFRNEYS